MRRELLYLQDIVSAIDRIASYVGSIQYSEFVETPILVDAVTRNLAIIGEAVRMLPEEMRVKAPEIPWSAIVATRNKLIHAYFGVDDEIVWDIVANHPEPLRKVATCLLKEGEEPIAGDQCT